MEERLSVRTRLFDEQSKSRTLVEYARGLAARQGTALTFAEDRYGATSPHATRIRAAVSSLTTGDPALSPMRTLGDAFLERTRRRSTLGRMAQWIRRVPMNVQVPVTVTPTVAAWFQQGGPMPATAMGFDLALLPPTTIGTLLGVSRELMQSASPEASDMIERDLDGAVVKMEDESVLGSDAAVALLRPAGLLHGVSPSGGGSPASLSDDVLDVIGSVRGGNIESPVFFASALGAAFVRSQHRDGVPEFPNARLVDGGDIWGVPLLIAPAAGQNLILVDASTIAVADAGLELSTSDQAGVMMQTDPSLPMTIVSAFQSNTSFIRITRFLHWVKGYADSVGYIQLDVAGGSPV